MHTGERPYQCNQCDRTFTQKGNMARHMSIHSKRYSCKECWPWKAFSTSSNLNKHQLIHTGEKPYKCTHCDKEFSQSSTLKGHMRIHTGEKPFKCSYCEKAFSLKFYLTTHMNTHVKKYESTNNIYRIKASNLDTNLDEEFKDHDTVHKNEVNEFITSTGPTLSFKCSKCDYKSATKFLLVRHSRKHTGEKPFTCPECDYKSAYESNMYAHIKNKHKWLTKNKGKKGRRKIKHTGEKTFACPECPYRCAYKNNLNSHIRGQHQWTIEHKSKKEIKCKPSGKDYPLRNKYFCIDCKIKCSSKDSFENHILSHEENLPTENVKTVEFYDNHNSKNDSQTEKYSMENIDLEDDQFECSICDYTSSFEKDIQEHSLICDNISDFHK